MISITKNHNFGLENSALMYSGAVSIQEWVKIVHILYFIEHLALNCSSQMPCPSTDLKIFWVGPNYLTLTKY